MVKQFKSIMNIIQCANAFGYRKLSNGTQLFGNVPHVGPEAWFHVVFAPLDTKGINSIEEDIEIELPISLRDFLCCANGLHLYSLSLSLDGRRTNYARTGDGIWQPFSMRTLNVDERLVDASPNMIFIGGYDWDGSLLYIDSSNEKVYRCAAESSRPINEWKNLWVMLAEEVFRLAKHFDATGHELDSTVPTAPESSIK